MEAPGDLSTYLPILRTKSIDTGFVLRACTIYKIFIRVRPAPHVRAPNEAIITIKNETKGIRITFMKFSIAIRVYFSL